MNYNLYTARYFCMEAHRCCKCVKALDGSIQKCREKRLFAVNKREKTYKVNSL